MRRWMVLGLLACACGSDSGSPDGGSGPGSITGTVGGLPLNVKDAVFSLDNNAVTVLVTDRENACALLGGTTLPGTTTVLIVSLANFVPPVLVNPHVTGNYAYFDLGGGTFPTTAGQYWYGGFETVTASCTVATTSLATGGTVNVTQTGTTSGTHFKANLNGLKFGSDTLNGSIEASYCPAVSSTSCGLAIARPPGPLE
jgi:hypothetical protein